MSLELSFKQACTLIKKDQPDLVDAIDKLLGLVLLCSPAFTGNVALLPFVTAKNELTKLSKATFEAITKRKSDTYYDRQIRMRMAYGLITYTAFFEALDYIIPEVLRSQMKLLDSEQAFIVKEAQTKTQDGAGKAATVAADSALLAQVPFPHPVETLDTQKKRLEPLYRQMSIGFKDLIQHLAAWEQLPEKEKLVISQAIEKLPEAAKDFFEAQYIELCQKYEEFAIWANIQEHKRAAALTENLSDYFKSYVLSRQSTLETIDIGLNRLHALVSSMPQMYKLARSEEVVEGLRKHYVARINDPIIEDKSEAEENIPRLQFPRVCDAFVPQSFCVLRVGSKRVPLEDSNTWRGLPRRDDLGSFILSYLSSPYSTESPLVVLGHPGSGKSLLTTVLSAQLLSQHFTAIKVPLREVNSEAGIVAQIEEHIGRVTSVRLDSWAKCSGSFENNPPVVILDGYDELLQASGKVFAGYLRDVQTFQRNEAEQGRPVRVLVTSRVTLIDKAHVPLGSTILRLLEFNELQRDRWISIWNSSNAAYFTSAKVKPFRLPAENDANAQKLLQLAEQPLLLLMLALYDSVDNKLLSGGIPDRTILYDSLLRRFVVREREKSIDFKNLPEHERLADIDRDMQRLGAAAIGMYNRRALHILSDQLSDDLKFFNLERALSVVSEGGRQLSQADLLLGSFFFVHKSRAKTEGDVGEQHESTAFEFLHNTFGEFLTADFIIRQTLAEIDELLELGSKPILRSQRDRKLGDVDGLSRLWFSCFVYTALFTRPVVLEMMREWIGHVLNRKGLHRANFIEELDAIFQSQIARVLGKREMPSIMRKDEAQEGYRASFESHPLIGHLAIYSLNLVIIRVVLADAPYEFQERQFLTHEDGTRPWDQLVHLWRSWFSLDSINGVTAVFKAVRTSNSLKISALTKIAVAESRSRLETLYNVNKSLGDNAASGLCGLALFEDGRRIDLDELSAMLKVEQIDLSPQIAQKKFSELVRREGRQNPRELARLAVDALHYADRSERIDDLVNAILGVGRLVDRYPIKRLFGGGRHPSELQDLLARIAFTQLVSVARYSSEAGRTLVRLIDVSEGNSSRKVSEELFHRIIVDRRTGRNFSSDNPSDLIIILDMYKSLNAFRWNQRFGEELLDRMLQEVDVVKWVERRPREVARLVQLLVDVGQARWADRIQEEFLRHFRQHHFLRFAEEDPNAAVELLFFASQWSHGDRLTSIAEDVLPRILAHVDFDDLLGDGEVDVFIKLLSVVRRTESERMYRYFNEGFFIHLFRRKHPIEWGRRHPEKAFELLEFALDLGARHWAVSFAEDFFKLPDIAEILISSLHHNTVTFAGAIRVARLLEGERASAQLRGHLKTAFERGREDQIASYRLPVGMLADLEWVKQGTRSAGFIAIIMQLISGRARSQNS